MCRGSLAWIVLIAGTGLAACAGTDQNPLAMANVPVIGSGAGGMGGGAAGAFAARGAAGASAMPASTGGSSGTAASIAGIGGAGGSPMSAPAGTGGSPGSGGTSGTAGAAAGAGGTAGRPAAGTGGGQAGGGAGTAATFTDVFTNILATKCAACHGSGGLNMSTKETAYSTIVDVDVAGECPGMKRVVPGDPAMSVLVLAIKAEGCRGLAGRMPPAGNPLSADEIAKIVAWVQDGAMNN